MAAKSKEFARAGGSRPGKMEAAVGTPIARSTVASQRVLLLVDHLEIGGAQQHVCVLAKHLVARGMQVEVGYTGRPQIRPDRAVSSVRLNPDKVARADSEELRRQALSRARELRPDIVHAHLFASALAGAWIAERLAIPLVLTHHSAGTWQRPSDRLLLRRALLAASHHFASSPQIRQSLLANGVSPTRAEFLPSAIEIPAEPAPRPEPSAELRLGFLGRLCPDKDPLLALRATATARAQGLAVSLRICGDGELRPEVQAEIGRLGLESAVAWEGFTHDVGRFFASIDVLLVSSASEGMPLAILEAMANEVPVLATRVGAIPQEVQDGVTGRLVPPGSVAALTDAFGWLAAHPRERQAMGCRARLIAIENFDIDRMAARVDAVYRSVRQPSPSAITSAPA